MPIPNLDKNGFLPVGIHECELIEIESVFGRFNESDRRCVLFGNLQRYINELNTAGVAKSVIINGYFVTKKSKPEDIDVLIVLKDGFVPTEDLPPFKRNLLNKKYSTYNNIIDFYFGYEDNPSATEMIDLFSKVKNQPNFTKGFLRINL